MPFFQCSLHQAGRTNGGRIDVYKRQGKYRAAANGDPTNLEQFHLPKMHTFNGMLTAIVQSGETAGEIVLTAKASGVKAGNIRIQTK